MYDDFTRKLFQEVGAPAKPGLRFGETTTSLLIGSLSASLGIVVMWAAVAGMLKRPLVEWNSQQFGVAGQFFDLSGLAAGVALVGLLLGVGGIALSRKKCV